MADELLQSRKKGKVHRKAEAEADPEFQIAPMIDILLVLLVFFMSISSTEVLQSNQDVKLPIAKAAKDSPPGTQDGVVIINVLFNVVNNVSTINVNDQDITAAQLTEQLKRKVILNPGLRVLIRADKQVRYEFMRSLLEAIGASNIGKITFSVVDKEEQ